MAIIMRSISVKSVQVSPLICPAGAKGRGFYDSIVLQERWQSTQCACRGFSEFSERP
jgi:hypothetical protein